MDAASKTFPQGPRIPDHLESDRVHQRSRSTRCRRRCSKRSLLVVLVILVFLQSWRAAIIPIVAIPVSLIGTFAVLAALGYSLNTLSMFGLVLAIGIVVDDAIVVVENVERNLEHGLSPTRGRAPLDGRGRRRRSSRSSSCCARCSCRPRSSRGITGEFYRQFAVTISQRRRSSRCCFR